MEPVTGTHVTDDIKRVKVSVKYKAGVGDVLTLCIKFQGMGSDIQD